jgi:predicted nuclease with TOPRIM domain
MADLKEIHNRMKQKRDEKKKLAEIFKDVFAQSKPYQEVLEQLKALKAKKLQLQHDLRSDLMKETEQMERIALDIQTDAALLSDAALTKLMKGETVEITDENDVKYEPVFKVTFKKAA